MVEIQFEVLIIKIEDSGLSYCMGYMNLWNAKFQLHRKEYQQAKIKTYDLKGANKRDAIRYINASQYAEYWFFIDVSNDIGSFNWFCDIFGLEKPAVLDTVNPNWRVLYGKQQS